MNLERAAAVLATLVGLSSAFYAYHASFEPAGSTEKALGAVFLFLKSQNQNAQNHYEGNIEAGQSVDTSRRRLESLKHEETYIHITQQQLGIRPKGDGGDE